MRFTTTSCLLLGMILAGATLVPSIGLAGPEMMHYQGFLRDDSGVPVVDPVDLEFTIFDAETDGTVVWTEAHAEVTPTDGVFSVTLGSATALTAALFDGAERWIETSVDGTPLTPRRQFLTAPYALRAAVADIALSGGEADNDWTIDGEDVYHLQGNVGVGTAGPLGRLHISGGVPAGAAPPDDRYDHLVVDDDLAAYINLRSSNTGYGGILFSDDARAAAHIRYDHTNQAMGFFAPTERVTISNAGNVGIGTNEPAATMHVMGDDLGLDAGDYPPSYDSVIEAEDATLVLYSGPSGIDGSKLVLSEVVAGEVTDNWYVIHKTSAQDGDLAFQFNTTETVRFASDGNVGIGTANPARKLHVNGDTFLGGETTVYGAFPNPASLRLSGTLENAVLQFDETSDILSVMTGQTGFEVVRLQIKNSGLAVNGTTTTDVLQITGGADLAEPFGVASSQEVIPGMVLSIDANNAGQLRVADRAHDRMVAGIASGACGVRAGITLQQEGTLAAGSVQVALSGRVYCLVDASYGAVHPGDLLTTSDTPGHAMRVSDHTAAQGAVIGKAMTSLETGRGHVLVLVNVN